MSMTFTLVCVCHLDKAIEREALHFLLDHMADGVITIPLDQSGHHLFKARERRVPMVLIRQVR